MGRASVLRDQQATKLRELGADGRLRLGCTLLDIARGLSERSAPSSRPSPTAFGVREDEEVSGPERSVRHAIDEVAALGYPYIVTGWMAASVHGATVVEPTIRITLQVPSEDHGAIRSTLEALGEGPVEERVDPEWGRRLVTVLPSGLDLQLFLSHGHPLYDRAFERPARRAFLGREIPFISPEDLILRKLVSTKLRKGQELADAIKVAKVQADRLDVGYLRGHCGVHRVCDLLEDILKGAGLGG